MLASNAKAVLDAMAAAGLPAIDTLSLAEAKRTFVENAARLTGDATDRRVSPLRALIPEDLAPAFVATAEYDVLHDEARECITRLKEAQVPVHLDENPGQIHGFVSMYGFIAEVRRCVGRAVDVWRASEMRTGGR